LGEIPSLNDFEPRRQFDMKRGDDGPLVPDFVQEDTALVYEDEGWIFIITGCSHAGICNIAEYAQKFFRKPVRGILGGLHLKDADERTAKTIAYFKEHKINDLYPCHCVSFAVKAAIDRELPIHECGAGMKIVVE
ncbi:MAG: MBL fold metallo-hydrolase, partial [Methanocorpusculum sp.]|nr:MBL fold metallo-hydrolase [Methanocorpusculum sp.]